MSAPVIPANLSALMEKIRGKAASHKGWPELVKMTKTVVEKRSYLVPDPSERTHVEKCLDTIQRNIRVTGLKSMIERLELITRQLGLKFTTGPTGRDVFISSDMFYVEVVLDPNTGYVSDVRIAHQSDPVSCPELTKVLRAADFTEFTKHMEGIAAIYQLNADSKQKLKAYTSLTCLEMDLSTLSQLQSYISEPVNIVHKTPVGVLEPRRGGFPMKLTFFVSPYDLIDRSTKSALPLSIDVVITKRLGHSANVCIESSTRNHKLQTKPLITVQKSNDGKDMPCPAAISNLNSTSLPACFVLKLIRPLPLSSDIIRKICGLVSIDFVTPEALAGRQSLIRLISLSVLPEKERNIVTQESENSNRQDSSFHVLLPDQEHVYFIHHNVPQLNGLTLSSIPFTHPTHVPQILVFLRQQVLFNTLIGSCMRKLSSYGSNETKFTFEITAQNMCHISVSFEHPVDESLASLEIDLKEITNVKCRLYSAASFAHLCSDEYASRIMQRSLSIPVTLRMVIVKSRERAAVLREQEIRAQQQQQQQQEQNNDLNYNLSTGDQGIDSSISSFLSQQFISNFGRQNGNSLEAATNAVQQQQHPVDSKLSSQQLQSAAQKAALVHNLSAQMQQQNIPVANILQRQLQQGLVRSMSTPHQQQLQQTKQNAMLLNMLSDIPAANSSQQQQQVVATAAAFTAFQQQQLQQQGLQNLPAHLQQQIELQNQMKLQQKRVRKRKNTGNANAPAAGAGSSTLPIGRSPKRKASEEEMLANRDVDMADSFPQSLTSPRPSPSGQRLGFDLTGAPVRLDQLLANLSNAETASMFVQGSEEIPADVMANYQLLQRSLSASAAVPSESLLMNQAEFMAKIQGKKRTARTRSSEEEEYLPSHSMADTSNYPTQITRPSSVGPITGQAKGKNLSAGRPASSDSMRRCSSAGLGDAGRNASPYNAMSSPFAESATVNTPFSPSGKKDKKRKRSESVDSGSMKSGASLSMMPPPLISSTGDVTTSTLASSPQDDSSPPGIRILKPMTPTSSSDAGESSGMTPKKVNPVSSTGSVGGIKVEKMKVSGGQVISQSAKGTKSLFKSNKSGTGVVQSSGAKMRQAAGTKKSLATVSSSSSATSVAKLNLAVNSPPVSSSSTPGSASPIPGANVSSSKLLSTSSNTALVSSQASRVQLQQQQLQSPQSACQSSSGLNVKKPKFTLNAVIDKLSKDKCVTTPASTDERPATESSPVSEDKIEASSTIANFSNRPDSSSSGKSGPVVKQTGDKQKFSRNADTSAVTLKSTLSGIKLTISKKPTSSTEAKPATKVKTATASSLIRTSPAPSSSSSPSPGLKAKSGAQVKKHAMGTSFKSGTKNAPYSVSSSSSSSSLLSTPPKTGAGRPVGSGKVSSSGASASKEKISSSGAGAILEEAIPRLRLDQLPKIPKTEKAAQANAAAAAAAAASSTPTSGSGTSAQPSSSVTPPIVGSQPLFRRPTGPGLRVDHQVVSSAMRGIDPPTDKFQSNAITSSYSQSQSQNQESASSSSSGLSPIGSPQVPPLPAAFFARTQGPSSSVPAANDTVGSSVSQANAPPDKGVTSSNVADADTEPTSTPSSPVESVSVSEANPPPIIPTESFDEGDSSERSRQRVDSTGNRESLIRSPAYEDESAAGCSSTSMTGGPDVADSEDLPVSSKDDEDDEDGLVIDVDYSAPTPTSNTASGKTDAPTPSDTVSSSLVIESQSGPSSPTPEKSPPADSSSPAAAVTPSASVSSSAFTWPATTASTSSTPLSPPATTSASNDGPASPSAPAAADPPYSIDDDLMDEALIGGEAGPSGEENSADQELPAPVLPAPASPVPAPSASVPSASSHNHHLVHEPEPEL